MAAQPEIPDPAGAAPELPGATPHQLHDDSLLASLVLVTAACWGVPCTAQQLPPRACPWWTSA